MIDHLKDNYSRPRNQFETAGVFPNQAAVLIAITDHPESPEIILTKRAEHLSTHSGEVSFPGGKWETTDQTLVETALRESLEEINLDPKVVDVINEQPRHTSMWGLEVTPYVGIIPHNVELIADKNELDAIFRVPVDFFINDKRTRTEVYQRRSREWWSPVYHYDGYKIWGLTARMLVDFVNMAWDANITREHASPELVR